jgi:hypothetical protein
MARRRSSRTGELATVGIVLLVVAALLWVSDERRLAIFVALGLFVPYLTALAPFKCGGYTRQRQACRRIGKGFLIGCSYHRFDRIGRIFGHDRDRAARRYPSPDSGVQAARSAGLAASRSPGQPTRLRAFDVLSLMISVSSMIAGWLALWIGP